MRHGVHRLGHGGVVEVWPTEKADDVDHVDPGRRSTRAAASAPAERLAERIATTIRGWLDSGEMLASEGRPHHRRRHPDPGAQAPPVRRPDGRRLEGARHRGRRRRPPAPERPDRRRGPRVARRIPHPAGGRPVPRRGAEKPAHRSRRRRSAGARASAARARCGSRSSTMPTTTRAIGRPPTR